jgi:hypothetical protein
MLYQNNAHWHGVASAAALAAVVLVLAAVAAVVLVLAVEADSLATVVASAVEADSLGMDSISISYKQPVKSILVMVMRKTQVPLIPDSTALPRQTVEERSVSTQE